ncbi:MAG TPA: thiamine pyrophosphate-binding protein [Chloroflexota bacterium]|jgi:benzoylformate decarboxylase|nr:thiamine pyrophosphate-binding protein [Chloroflexota bacterium]
MSGKRALLEQLIADDVRYIFGNPGTTEQGFMDVLQDYPQLQFMLALHEGVAVCMADAYARLTRRPAFVEVHIAPGLGNALGMMHNARIGKTPLVVYAGQSPSNVLLQEPHLSGPLVEMARPIAKWAAQIEHAHDVPRALRRAFKIAAEPPQGPVFLALPMDVLDAEADMDIAPTTYTNWRTRPDQAGLAEVAEMLVRAERPMLMLGDSVATSEAQAEAAAVAELLGAPMFECYASEFNVSATHPLNLGSVDFVSPKNITSTLADCDVLFVVGAPLFQLIFPDPQRAVVGPQTRVIQLDSISHELGKNVRPDIALLGDPKAGLGELAVLIAERQSGSAREAALDRRQQAEARVAQANERYWAAARKNWDATPISGARLMHEIKRALPENGLVFSEGVTNTKHVEMAIAPTQPGQLVKVRGGGIGPGLPGSLGAALARPDRRVVGVCSDGAAMYSITALWTAAHHKIPVTYVMLSNRAYRILKLNMLEYLGEGAREREFVAMDLIDPELRFDRMAESMGVPSRRVERPEDLAEVLQEAIAYRDGPFLVDAVIDGSVAGR